MSEVKNVIFLKSLVERTVYRWPDGTRARSFQVCFLTKGNPWPDYNHPLGIIRPPGILNESGEPVQKLIEPETLPDTLMDYRDKPINVTYEGITAQINEDVWQAIQAALGNNSTS